MEVAVAMRKILLVLSVLILSGLAPGLLLADCVDLGYFTDWALQDSRTIILYRGRRPLATIRLADCTVQPSSRIRLVQSYVCEADKIQIDDETCSIMNVRGSHSTYP